MDMLLFTKTSLLPPLLLMHLITVQYEIGKLVLICCYKKRCTLKKSTRIDFDCCEFMAPPFDALSKGLAG